MDRLLKRTQRVRPAAFCSRDFFLLQDNVPAHKVVIFCQFLTPKMSQPCITPPYPPDISPPDYFLFAKLKMKLKGLHFADVAEIQGTVTDELKKVQKRRICGSSSETVQPRKNLPICQWTLFWIKKLRVFLMSLRFLKKSVLKFWTALYTYIDIYLHAYLINK